MSVGTVWAELESWFQDEGAVAIQAQEAEAGRQGWDGIPGSGL